MESAICPALNVLGTPLKRCGCQPMTGWYRDGFCNTDDADLGSQHMLDAYHKARFGDIQLRLRGIDLLNRASQATTPLARDARAKGLSALYALPPVRRMLMEMGLGMRQG